MSIRAQHISSPINSEEAQKERIISVLRAENAQLKANTKLYEQLKLQLIQLHSKINQLEQDNQQQVADHALKMQVHNNAINHLNNRIKEVSSLITEKEKENTNLQLTSHSLTASQTEKDSKYQEINKKLTSKKEIQAQLQYTMRTMLLDIAHEKEIKANIENDINDMEGKSEVYDQKLNDLEKDLITKDTESKLAKAKLEESRKELTELRQNLEKLNDVIKEEAALSKGEEGDLATQESEIQKLNQDNNKCNSIIEDIEAEIAQYSTQVESLDEILNNKQSDLAMAKITLLNKEKENDTTSREITLNKKQIIDIETLINISKKDVEEQKKQKDHETNKKTELSTELAKLEATLRLKELQLNKLQEEIRHTQSLIEDKLKDKTQLQDKILSLKEHSDILTQQNIDVYYSSA